MGSEHRHNITENSSRPSTLGLVGTAVFVGFSALAAVSGRDKILAISWVAFVAMVLGASVGARADETSPHGLVWGYGLSSGAMITSAAMFIIPEAIELGVEAGAAQLAGIGIATGIVAGYSAHVVGHRLTHVDVSFDVSAVELTLHTFAEGLIIGFVYVTMPALGLLLGFAIVSHKGPAGYAAARRLVRSGKSSSALLLPAAGVGLAAIPIGLLSLPSGSLRNALVMGFAAGIFLHLAMDFLPNCEAGSEIDDVCSLSEDSHHLLDELRTHAVGSTVIGGIAVVVVWFVI